MSLIIFLVCLIFLYLTHQKMIKELSRLLHHLGGGRKTIVWIWSVFFLPGTIIHEVSHFLAAAITGARTGNLEIFPEFLESDDDGREDIALGYLQTQRLNPIQGFLVGTAPFVSGLALLVFISTQLETYFNNQNYLILGLLIYLFFVIANSFFLSWSDLKQTLPLIAISLVIILIFYLLDFKISLSSSSQMINILNTTNNALYISLGLNLIITTFLYFSNKLLRR